MLNYPLNKTMGSCLESSFSCWVGDEEKDAAAKIDLDKQRAEAWGLWDSGLRGVCGDWFLELWTVNLSPCWMKGFGWGLEVVVYCWAKMFKIRDSCSDLELKKLTANHFSTIFVKVETFRCSYINLILNTAANSKRIQHLLHIYIYS